MSALPRLKAFSASACCCLGGAEFCARALKAIDSRSIGVSSKCGSFLIDAICFSIGKEIFLRRWDQKFIRRHPDVLEPRSVGHDNIGEGGAYRDRY